MTPRARAHGVSLTIATAGADAFVVSERVLLLVGREGLPAGFVAVGEAEELHALGFTLRRDM